MPPRAARPDPPLLYRPSAVARLLGISAKLARAMIARRELPSVRLGSHVFVPRAALEALLQQLPGTTVAEAIRRLAARGIVAGGHRPEVVEIDESERP
jgi:excisionase family DNA binding protein